MFMSPPPKARGTYDMVLMHILLASALVLVLALA